MLFPYIQRDLGVNGTSSDADISIAPFPYSVKVNTGVTRWCYMADWWSFCGVID